MIRQLQTWADTDFVHASQNAEFNVDASNVVYGKSYETELNDSETPGMNMLADLYVDDVCSVSVNSCATSTSSTGGIMTAVYIGDDFETPPVAMPVPDSVGYNPAVTAHLERLEDEADHVIMDIVYEYSEDSSGNPDIYHMRFVQDTEGDFDDFTLLYGPYKVNGLHETYCWHPDIVYDARTWEDEHGHLYCVYECRTLQGNVVVFASLEDPYPFDEEPDSSDWSHDIISDVGAMYPRLDVGNVMVDIGEETLDIWSVVVVWMELDDGLDIRWSWGMVGGAPDMASGFIPTCPGFESDWNCYIPFVDIAPYEYQMGQGEHHSSVNITYTQEQDMDEDEVFDAAALYTGIGKIVLGQAPEFHQYYIYAEDGWDEGLPQVAIAADGSFDGRFVYLRALQCFPILPLNVWSAITDWSTWEGNPEDGVYDQFETVAKVRLGA